MNTVTVDSTVRVQTNNATQLKIVYIFKKMKHIEIFRCLIFNAYKFYFQILKSIVIHVIVFICVIVNVCNFLLYCVSRYLV